MQAIMFFVVAILMLWVPVGVNLYLFKAGYKWADGRPLKEAMPAGCAGVLLGGILTLAFGSLALGVSPVFVVLAAPAVTMYFYSGMILLERMANGIGICPDKRGRADELPRVVWPWEAKREAERDVPQ